MQYILSEGTQMLTINYLLINLKNNSLRILFSIKGIDECVLEINSHPEK